jgi:hypothetical protein
MDRDRRIQESQRIARRGRSGELDVVVCVGTTGCHAIRFAGGNSTSGCGQTRGIDCRYGGSRGVRLQSRSRASGEDESRDNRARSTYFSGHMHLTKMSFRDIRVGKRTKASHIH